MYPFGLQFCNFKIIGVYRRLAASILFMACPDNIFTNKLFNIILIFDFSISPSRPMKWKINRTLLGSHGV
jgi:hypothetical protein